MKAGEAGLLTFLRRSPQFVIPIYQRTYSWTSAECRQLWDDIIRAGGDDGISVHFVGSIVYIETGLGQIINPSSLLVIDGQQRLTTVSLLIAALANALGENEPVEGFSPRKLRNLYLLNPEDEGERRYKLLLSQTDKASMMAIVGERALPKERERSGSARSMFQVARLSGTLEYKRRLTSRPWLPFPVTSCTVLSNSCQTIA